MLDLHTLSIVVHALSGSCRRNTGPPKCLSIRHESGISKWRGKVDIIVHLTSCYQTDSDGFWEQMDYLQVR